MGYYNSEGKLFGHNNIFLNNAIFVEMSDKIKLNLIFMKDEDLKSYHKDLIEVGYKCKEIDYLKIL